MKGGLAIETEPSAPKTLDPFFRDRIISEIEAGYPYSESLITISENLILNGDYRGAKRLLGALLERADSDGDYFRGRVHKMLGDIHFTW